MVFLELPQRPATPLIVVQRTLRGHLSHTTPYPSPEPVARDDDGYHPFRETTAVAFTAQYTDFAGRLCSVAGTVLFHYRCEVLRTTKIC